MFYAGGGRQIDKNGKFGPFRKVLFAAGVVLFFFVLTGIVIFKTRILQTDMEGAIRKESSGKVQGKEKEDAIVWEKVALAEEETETEPDRKMEDRVEQSSDLWAADRGQDVKPKVDEMEQTAIRMTGTDMENDGGEGAALVLQEPVDENVLEALTAYQKYVDAYKEQHKDSGLAGYVLAYLDEDDIPELIAIGSCEASGQVIVTYRDGQLQENYIKRLGGLRYVEKGNFYCNANGHMGLYYDEFYRLVDGKQTAMKSGQWGDRHDEEGNIIWNEEGDCPQKEYAWEGKECSEEEYYAAMDQFVQETVGDAAFIQVNWYGGYADMGKAYEGLKYRSYSAYWPQIREFRLEDGVLTYAVGGGGSYGWGSNDDMMYTISYPVAPDCIWEDRGVGMGEHYQPQVADTDYIRDTTYEKMKEWIDKEKKWFDEAAAEFGRDGMRAESPVNIVVVVKEGVVVRVYTVSS